MAITIGSQLESKLEEIVRMQGLMQSLAIIGPGLRKFEDFEAFANIVEYIESVQSNVVDDLQTFIKRNVLPIVAHINDRV